MKLYASRKLETMSFALVTVLFFAACGAALQTPDSVTRGVRSGVDYSLNVLLPSLYPFMFLSAFASEYGISGRIGRLLAPLTRHVLYLPGSAGVTVLLSLVGGFPVGAVGISSLLRHEKITEKQAMRMLCFCVNPGPAFLISAVGSELYKSTMVGVILFAAQTSASLLMGIILGIIARFSEKLEKESREQASPCGFPEAFVRSARHACGSAVSLCSLVVLFSAFSELLLTRLGIGSDTVEGAAIRAVLEVTDGCVCLEKCRLPIYFTALAVGFGGLCVHFQIFAALPNFKINKIKFTAARVFSGILSCGITAVVTRFAGTAVEAAFMDSPISTSFSASSHTASAALLMSSVMFILFIGRESESVIQYCKTDILHGV